jgi:hypothetical protein
MDKITLEKLAIVQKSGNEPLTLNGKELSYKLSDFWQWSVSDILSNATRGVFAEFIVATALNIDLQDVREEWSAYDLESPEGIKLEVKSASYVQRWFQNDYSKISFSIKPARYWDSATNKQHEIPARSADVYVFCLLHYKDKESINPLNLDQWEFYVISTETLNGYTRSQTFITLPSLKRLAKAINYEFLGHAIRDMKHTR